MIKDIIKIIMLLVCLVVTFCFGIARGQDMAIKSAQFESSCRNGDYYISFSDFFTGNREVYEYYGVNE